MKSYKDKSPLGWICVVIGVILLFYIYIESPSNQTLSTKEKQTSLSEVSKINIEPSFESKEDFFNQIKSSLLDGYSEISITDWKNKYRDVLATPEYLPKRFLYYDGVFIKQDEVIPEQIMTTQLWYDPQTYEILRVTQEKTDKSDSVGTFGFFNRFMDEVSVSNYYPWVSYCSTYPLVNNGMSIDGYMLVKDENSKDECEQILTSLHI